VSWDGEDYITEDEFEILQLCLWDEFQKLSHEERLEISAAARRHLLDQNEPDPCEIMMARAWQQASQFR
jgi:hypothetical protein